MAEGLLRPSMNKLLRKIGFFGLLVFAFSNEGDASAQSYLSPGYVLGEITHGLGIYAVPEAPDFVKRARPDPASLDYTPLKPPPRDFHSEAAKPSSQLQAEAPAIAELESARAATQARAAASGAPASKASAKTPPVVVTDDPPPMKWNPWDTE